MATEAKLDCFCCKSHTKCCNSFTKHTLSWSKSLRNVPKTTPETLTEWMKRCGRKCICEKSYKFFREGYVHDMYASDRNEENMYFIKCCCYRSLRKNEKPHDTVILLKESKEKIANAQKAHCSCKAGSGGHCSHVFALLYQLNDFSCLKIKDIPSDATCTSLPQQWHIPRAPSIQPLPVMGTHFARASTDRDKERSREPVRCKLYDARGPVHQTGLNSRNVMDQVNYLGKKDKPPPFSYLLADQEPALNVNTVFGNVPVGSYLSYQLNDFGRPGTLFVTNNIRYDLPSDEICKEFPDIPMFDSAVKIFDIDALQSPNAHYFFEDYILIDVDEAQTLEKMTILQGECPEWIEQHKYRLTASNFGKVYFRVKKPTESMFSSIFENKDLSKVKAVTHGKVKEKAARSIYAKKMQKKTKNYAVFDAGLAVLPSIPYLAASPDGKVFDPSSSSKYGLLEIKCPYSKRDETLEQAAEDSTFYLKNQGGKYYLKSEHQSGYFAQVQGQLALTGLPWCDFCVFLSNSNEMCVDRIYFDQHYWSQKLFPKLEEFYMKHALQYLVDREYDDE